MEKEGYSRRLRKEDHFRYSNPPCPREKRHLMHRLKSKSVSVNKIALFISNTAKFLSVINLRIGCTLRNVFRVEVSRVCEGFCSIE